MNDIDIKLEQNQRDIDRLIEEREQLVAKKNQNGNMEIF